MKETSKLFIALFVVAFQLLLALPVSIWAQNQFNFNVALWDSVGFLALLLVAVAVVLLLFASVIPKRICSNLAALCAVCAIALFVQQNILVWNYGVMDGSQLQFSENKYLGYIDIGMWLLALGCFFFFRKAIRKRTSLILTFTSLVTLISLAGTILTYGLGQNNNSGSVTEVDKYRYSTEKNIFVFVLDGFQSDLLWDLYDNDPEVMKPFSGFTFYPNTTSVFAKTYPSIPLLLTGRKYQKKESIRDFIREAYDDSVLTELVDNGWDVGLYPVVESTIRFDESIMSNYVDDNRWSTIVSSYFQALDLSLFRSVPHSAKERVYNEGLFLFQDRFNRQALEVDRFFGEEKAVKFSKKNKHRGLNFLANFKQESETNSPKPAFRYYHFSIPHAPFLLDKDWNFQSENIGGFNAYREYAYAGIRIVGECLDELKRLGVYDNSTIIITADHGGGEYMSGKYTTASKSFIPILDFGKVKSSGRPLLMVKNYGEAGDIQLSRKPLSLLDVAPTVAASAGVDIEVEGKNVAEVSEEDERSRTFYYYKFSGWDSKYLNKFTVFQIDGFAYDESAWSNLGRFEHAVDMPVGDESAYRIGSMIRYGTDFKNDAIYLNRFIEEEDYFYGNSYIRAFSENIEVSLDLEKPLAKDTSYFAELYISSSRSVSPEIVVKVNDQETTFMKVANKKKRKSVFFNSSEIGSIDNSIRFNISLRNPNTNNTQIYLSGLKLEKTKISEFSPGERIEFSEVLEGHYPEGFWRAEKRGRWTSSRDAIIRFSVSDKSKNASYLKVEVNRFIKGVDSSLFEVHLNGVKLERVEWGKHIGKVNKTFLFHWPDLMNAVSRVHELRFKVDKVVSPHSLGHGGDRRLLGVSIKNISLSRSEVPELSTTANIDFTKSLEAYLPEGLWHAEGTGRWTSSKDAIVCFAIFDDPEDEFYIKVEVERFFEGVDPAHFEAFLNGVKLERVQLAGNDGESQQVFVFSCPSLKVGSEYLNELLLRTDKAHSPYSIGSGDDTRPLGVYIKNVSLLDLEASKE